MSRTSDPKPKDPLAPYIKTTGMSDAAIGRLLNWSRWKVSRGRRGEQPFTIQDQIALEKFTGATPAQWSEYYEKLLKGRAEKTKRPLESPAEADA